MGALAFKAAEFANGPELPPHLTSLPIFLVEACLLYPDSEGKLVHL